MRGAASDYQLLPTYAENLLQKQRAHLILEFDSAAARYPSDSWIAGQRVRLDVDQRSYPRGGHRRALQSPAPARHLVVRHAHRIPRVGRGRPDRAG